jgi:hypothetical protein
MGRSERAKRPTAPAIRAEAPRRTWDAPFFVHLGIVAAGACYFLMPSRSAPVDLVSSTVVDGILATHTILHVRSPPRSRG